MSWVIAVGFLMASGGPIVDPRSGDGLNGSLVDDVTQESGGFLNCLGNRLIVDTALPWQDQRNGESQTNRLSPPSRKHYGGGTRMPYAAAKMAALPDETAKVRTIHARHF